MIICSLIRARLRRALVRFAALGMVLAAALGLHGAASGETRPQARRPGEVALARFPSEVTATMGDLRPERGLQRRIRPAGHRFSSLGPSLAPASRRIRERSSETFPPWIALRRVDENPPAWPFTIEKASRLPSRTCHAYVHAGLTVYAAERERLEAAR